MTALRIVHVGDLHLGGMADPVQLDALEREVPELAPDAVVLAGDLTQRARHGEFLAVRALVGRLAAACPVHVIPGNHDVQWWWRPLVPFAAGAKYAKFRRYFGPDLAPTLHLPGAVIASVLTSHGVAWGSLTPRIRDVAVKGHLPAAEIKRAAAVLAAAPADATRILVVHHNVLRGELSRRMGLARWRQAQRRIADSGAELVLCAHDHQEGAGMMLGRVVVSTTGTLSTRTRGDGVSAFNLVEVELDRFRITFHRWDPGARRFRASDAHVFARHVDHTPAAEDAGSGARG